MPKQPIASIASLVTRIFARARVIQVGALLVLSITAIRLPSIFRRIGNAASSSSSALAAMATKYPIKCAESVMAPKAHGTCPAPVQKDLRWGCDWDTADRICCFNRHYAEHSGYWVGIDAFKEEMEKGQEITFFDSVTGKPLFVAPKVRVGPPVMQRPCHLWARLFCNVPATCYTSSHNTSPYPSPCPFRR